MNTNIIEFFLEDKGTIPPELVEELHLLIKERERGTPSQKAKIFPDGVSYSIHPKGHGCCVEESRLEEMYKCYMFAEKVPALTFSQYISAVEYITGIRAA